MQVLLKFLGAIQRANFAGDLLESEYFNVCLLVKQGRLGDAKSALDLSVTSKQFPQAMQASNNDAESFVEWEQANQWLEDDRKSIQLALALQELDRSEVAIIACQECKTVVHDIEPVKTCGHIFHPLCLLKAVSAKIKEGVYPVTCPVRDCGVTVQLEDVKALPFNLVRDSQIFQQAYFFYQQNPELVVSCPTHYCSATAPVPVGRDLHCGSCKLSYCLRCRGPTHVGSSCEAKKPHLSSIDLDNMLAVAKMGMKLRACPNCKWWNPWVAYQMKITCSCGLVFCSHCGARGTCTCRAYR